MILSDTVTNKKSINSFEAFRDRTLAKFPEDKFDFSEAVYFNNSTPIKIFCKEHKVWFYRRPYHLDTRNCGCEQCFKEVHKERRLTQEEYIQRAYEIHGNKYDFSETIYVKSDVPITAWCNIHNEYFTLNQASDLTNGDPRGCPKCGNTKKGICSTTAEFIIKADTVHKNRYDYSKVSYVNNRTPIEIICKEHVVFIQNPDAHLSGKGCQVCANINKRKRYHKIPTTLYYIEVIKDDKKYYKIGITTKSLNIRFKPSKHKFISIREIASIEFLHGKEAFEKEQEILNRFKHLQTKDEVLTLTYPSGNTCSNGNSEVFDEDIWEHISHYFE